MIATPLAVVAVKPVKDAHAVVVVAEHVKVYEVSPVTTSTVDAALDTQTRLKTAGRALSMET
jgi:hypothetical protein